MRTDHTPDDRRTDDSTIPAYDDPVDVALEVAQDLADDRDVRRYIRRARQARIAACEPDEDGRDAVDECPGCGSSRFCPHGGPGSYWCENCELEYIDFGDEWRRCGFDGVVEVLEDGGTA